MKKVVTGVVLIFIVGIFFLINYNVNPPSYTLDNLKSNFFEDFSLEVISESEFSQLIYGSKDDSILKIYINTGLEPGDVESFVGDRIFMFNSLFRKIASPYPGALTNQIECPDELKPVVVEHLPFNYFKTYASQSETYGVCSWDLVKYKSIFYFLYCEDDLTVYQIKLFVPFEEDISKYEILLAELECM